jgi:hypothetical protein
VSHLMAPVSLTGIFYTESSIVTAPEFGAADRVWSEEPRA